ncbi:MAG: outer membrane beta-barrel protein [Chitinophagaceae bacterium]
MCKVYFLLFVVLIAKTGFAQSERKVEKASVTGRFYGRIIDATSNKGLAATSVQLVNRKYDKVSKIVNDVPVDGMLTLKNGDFQFENVSISSGLVLLVSALGFTKYEANIMANQKGLKKQELDMDLGNIRLAIDPKLLQSVTVTAKKPLMSLGIDRKVFNVEKSLTAAGGTAEDVMRSVPSLSVDIDGGITLRNSSPQIFVDGRPTSMSLDQIPADAIESVEIITNPSAKFDASGGGGGIVNIVLKRNRKAGYNGSLKAGLDQRGRFSMGADFNVRQGKINVFTSVSYRQRKSISTGKTDRLTYIDMANTQLVQRDNNIQEKSNVFLRAGFDYLIDNRNTITVTGFTSNGRSNNRAITRLYIDTIRTGSLSSSFSERLSLPVADFKNNGTTIGYKHLFARAGKEFTADINYNPGSNHHSNTITTSAYDVIGEPVSKSFSQLVDGSGDNSTLTFQTDYIDPISKNSKIELGARAQLKNAANLNSISYTNESGILVQIPQLSSNYLNSNDVIAGYASFSNKRKLFGYQFGLRIENSNYRGEVISAGKSGQDSLIQYGNSFPFSLFPSIFLTHELSKAQQLQFSATRRINRPDFWQLFPFTDYSDSLNIGRGNPGLKPEFTYSAEMAYEKTFTGKNTLLASAYFKYTDQLITRFQQKEISSFTGKENLVNTFVNAHSSYTSGLEFIYRQSMAEWWEMTSNLNFFLTKIDLGEAVIIDQKNIYSWFGKLNNTFKLPRSFSFEIRSEYSSKRILPQGGGKSGTGKDGSISFGQPPSTSQGYIRPKLEVDAAVRYDFLKNKKASLTLHVSDIFRCGASNTFSESVYFRQNSYRLRDPQYIRLHFNWRFGKFDASLFKRKNNKAGEEVMEESEQ